MPLSKAVKALRARASKVGLPTTASIEEIEVKEDQRKRAKAVKLPVTALIEEIEAAEKAAEEVKAEKKEKKEPPKDPPAPSAKADKGFKGGFKKVKATNEEVMGYQEQGVLYGWDPRSGIATIREAPEVGFKFHQPSE